MHIVVSDTIAEIEAKQWNALLKDNNPFMRHEFLNGLELCACVCPATGWQPKHIAIYSNTNSDELIGAMPCYIKSHSYGEYIFDWAWAEAYHRHGVDYYPKLSNAVPFTPATGPRWLRRDEGQTEITQTLINAAMALVDEHQLTGLHSLFLTETQSDEAIRMGLSERHSLQFHWQNQNYQSFDDFLGRFTSKKRKNIRRERRKVAESNVQFQWLTGHQLSPSKVEIMYKFYLSTIRLYGAQAYLNRDFFQHLASHLPEQTLFLFAMHDEQIIAASLFLRSDHTLYGRYWGALNNFDSIHFEACYYQAIQWCIEHQYQHFEAGAQGSHKLSRGLNPTTTYSAHWIADPDFRKAIDQFLKQEKAHRLKNNKVLEMHSPYKNEI